MSIDPFPRPRRRRRLNVENSPDDVAKTGWTTSHLWVVPAALLLLLAVAFLAGEESSPPLASPTTLPPFSAQANAVVAPIAVSTAAIEPATALPGMKLRVVVYPAPASLPGQLLYQWYRNGLPIDGAATEELETDDFVRNDSITVSVSRQNDTVQAEVRSLPVVLGNRSPVIAPGAFGSVFDGKYINQVHAIDPDGDPVTFALANAPPDMSIDTTTGMISWPLPADLRGQYSYRVVASDGTTASLQQINITLGEPL